MSTAVKTGQKVLVSGRYKPVGCKTEITLVKDKNVPPSKLGTIKRILVDQTKHKGGI